MRVGSIVECIGDFNEAAKECKAPVKGKIYTVRDIDNHPFGIPGDFIRLEEIVNPPEGLLELEPSFWTEKFRELLPPIELNIEELLTEKI